MKITGLKLMLYTVPYTPRYPHEARQVGPLDIYEEYASGARRAGMPGSGKTQDGLCSDAFIVITTDEGVEGIHGPVDYRVQLLVAADALAAHLIGRDPLENRLLWDILSRFERHARSGAMLMAISAVDNALWDLKGKILGQPVYKLLGGGRHTLRPYVSMLGFSVEPERVRERAHMVQAMGVRAQKWFFRYGPGDGTAGMRANLAMAQALREAVGPDDEIMFDCWMGWDIAYARTMFRELEPLRPAFVEEVLRPHMADAYRALRQETRIPLAAGEHFYTRMEVAPYLREGTFAVMQSDPEWCGGITEALRIADLCELHGVRFIPHGHALLPAMHVVAAMPPDVCPYVEYLLNFMDHKCCFYKHDRMQPGGLLALNTEPGLGEDVDMARVTQAREIKAWEV